MGSQNDGQCAKWMMLSAVIQGARLILMKELAAEINLSYGAL